MHVPGAPGSDFQVDKKRGWIIRGINALVVQ
jgi:hypothetical protein